MSNTLKTTALLAALSALLLFIGQAMGGAQGLLIALVFAIGTNAMSYWFSDRIVLAMYRAQPVGPEHPFYGLVADLATRAGLPMPRVYIIPDPSPNAFATGRNPQHAAVAATEGILRTLDRQELEGVIAHELSHVRHRDILISSVAATLAAAIMAIARFAMFFGGGRNDREGSNPLGLLLMLIVAPIGAMLIQMAISRSREFAADAGAAALVGSPDGLVSALRKIDVLAGRVPLDGSPATAHMFIINPFKGRGLASLFSTHPATEARIAALMARR